jgi:hypothetical protein
LIELRAEPSYEDVLLVAQNLRVRDQEEIFATRWTHDPEHLAENVVNTGAFRWGAYLDGKPVAMIGAAPLWPGVWSVWAFGTDDWSKAVRVLTKHVKRFMIPALEQANYKRAFCYALATHDDARRWLKALGAHEETTLANWGKNGQTFVCYCWLRETTTG